MSPAEYGEGYRSDYINMYHQYVASADRISERRGNANTFFVTANTALLGATEYMGGEFNNLWVPAISGVGMCIIWRGLIISYKNLNSAKFAVILDMEKTLPAAPYGNEWTQIKQAKSGRKHIPLSDYESFTPLAFGVLYVFQGIMSCCGYFN
jgi:hypothetical protein